MNTSTSANPQSAAAAAFDPIVCQPIYITTLSSHGIKEDAALAAGVTLLEVACERLESPRFAQEEALAMEAARDRVESQLLRQLTTSNPTPSVLLRVLKHLDSRAKQSQQKPKPARS